ncbi:ketose-bisphosphate aldolase [Atribacter sp.]|jgi:ketose-bisphosphate aldolase|uniref:class II fructose-bisphosphate aldolase n=1 Tax=Atribacter sp. TaxID=2847780 RepID=UPI00345E721E
MLYFSPLELILKAKQKKVALGSFNVFNIEMFHAVTIAASKKKSPVIIATGEVDIQYFPPEFAVSLMKIYSKKFDIPFILHLDHCTQVELAEKCLRCGYSSIMFDGSQLPYEENVEKTRSVVKIAQWFGVPVEGELGVILGTHEFFESAAQKDIQLKITDPEAARDFVLRTGIHTLAPSIGSAHGVYVEKPKIHFDTLKRISEVTHIPLVLHGGSGIPVEDVHRCLEEGVAKVNVGTDIRRTLVDTIAHEGINSYVEARTIMEKSRDAIVTVVENWLDILKSPVILQ